MWNHGSSLDAQAEQNLLCTTLTVFYLVWSLYPKYFGMASSSKPNKAASEDNKEDSSYVTQYTNKPQFLMTLPCIPLCKSCQYLPSNYIPPSTVLFLEKVISGEIGVPVCTAYCITT